MLAVSVSRIWRMECGSHSSLCRALHFQAALQVISKSCREARGSLLNQKRLPLDILCVAKLVRLQFWDGLYGKVLAHSVPQMGWKIFI